MDILTPQPEHKTLIDYLIASTPAVTAVFVAVIGWLQWKTADSKLQLDRYGRRFEVFSVTVHFFNRLYGNIQEDRVGFEKLRMEFAVKMLESQYLFDAESGIYPLLLEIQARSSTTIYKKTDMEKDQVGIKTRIEFLTLSEDDDKFIRSSMPVLTEKMSPYLSIRDSRYFKWKRPSALKYAKQNTQRADEIETRLRKRFFSPSPTSQRPANPIGPATSQTPNVRNTSQVAVNITLNP